MASSAASFCDPGHMAIGSASPGRRVAIAWRDARSVPSASCTVPPSASSRASVLLAAAGDPTRARESKPRMPPPFMLAACSASRRSSPASAPPLPLGDRSAASGDLAAGSLYLIENTSAPPSTWPVSNSSTVVSPSTSLFLSASGPSHVSPVATLAMSSCGRFSPTKAAKSASTWLGVGVGLGLGVRVGVGVGVGVA